MSIEIKVPVLPESVADATIATWYKKPGDIVKQDENLVDIETDKVMLECPAPQSGILQEIKKEQGGTVIAQEVIAILKEQSIEDTDKPNLLEKDQVDNKALDIDADNKSHGSLLSPAVRRAVNEHDLDLANISGTGKDGRISKQDVFLVGERR